MPTKDFEEEILYLLRRMKGRIDQKGHDGASRKMKSNSCPEFKLIMFRLFLGERRSKDRKSTRRTPVTSLSRMPSSA